MSAVDYRTSARAPKPAIVLRSPTPWHVPLVCALLVSLVLVLPAFGLRTEMLVCTREPGAIEASCSVSNSFVGVPIWPTRRFRATSLSLVVVSTSKDGHCAYHVRPDDRAEDDVDVVGGNVTAAKIGWPLYQFEVDKNRTAVAVDTVDVPAVGAGILLFIDLVVITLVTLYMRMRWITGSVALYEDDRRVVLTRKRWLARPSVDEIPWHAELTFFSRDQTHTNAVTFHWIGIRTDAKRERLLWRTFSAAGAKRMAESMNRALAGRA